MNGAADRGAHGGAPLAMAAVACALLVALVVSSMCVGTTWHPPATALRALAASCGVGEAVGEPLQTILELRLWRALCAALVGGALAYSGGLIQGVFRNGLASPSLIGVSGGAALGAALAILVVGGYAPRLVLEQAAGAQALLIPFAAFAGALATTAVVAFLASGRGRISVTTLLLVGIAVNMCVGGLFAAIQFLSLKDWEVSKAILAWTFGTLTDRSGTHCATVAVGLALALAAIPFVARELDLFKGGEGDAAALGVGVERVKLVALVAASLAAASAVAVAGQIAFVGLIVPHLLRALGFTRYRALLPLAPPAGAVFLLGADLLQRATLGEGVLQPGVMMSLVGGPFFLFLLLRQRREVSAW